MALIRITAPHFVAGVVVGGPCAPIIAYMVGWPLDRIVAYCRRKKWTAEILGD